MRETRSSSNRGFTWATRTGDQPLIASGLVAYAETKPLVAMSGESLSREVNAREMLGRINRASELAHSSDDSATLGSSQLFLIDDQSSATPRDTVDVTRFFLDEPRETRFTYARVLLSSNLLALQDSPANQQETVERLPRD
jgi:hypothetical protein